MANESLNLIKSHNERLKNFIVRINTVLLLKRKTIDRIDYRN